MPIINKVGDLLTDPEVNVLLQQCNLYHTFGAGIAAAIKTKFPEAYDADCATVKGDSGKLGTYSKAMSGDKMVVNVYSQTGMGAKDRNTSYNDIFTVFSTIEEKVRVWNAANPGKEKVLGVPYKFGAGLAGGRWRIINAIFEEVFKNSPVKLVIVRLASEPEIAL
jgi:hypothetical protein